MTRRELIAQLTVIAKVAEAVPENQSIAVVLFSLCAALHTSAAAVDALADIAARFCRDLLRGLDARQN